VQVLRLRRKSQWSTSFRVAVAAASLRVAVPAASVRLALAAASLRIAVAAASLRLALPAAVRLAAAAAAAAAADSAASAPAAKGPPPPPAPPLDAAQASAKAEAAEAKKAKSAAKSAAKRDKGERARVLLQVAKYHLSKQDFEAAEKALRAAIAERGTFAEAHFRLGLLLEDESRDFGGAAACYSRALEITKKAHFRVEALCRLGAICQFVNTDIAGAEAHYRDAIDEDHTSQDARCLLAMLLGMRHDCDSEEALRRYMLVSRGDTASCINIGIRVFAMGPAGRVGAKWLLHAAIRHDDTDLDAWHNLCTVMCEENNWAEGARRPWHVRHLVPPACWLPP
jgi:tetratricopeptide (TPR) repeat protein